MRPFSFFFFSFFFFFWSATVPGFPAARSHQCFLMIFLTRTTDFVEKEELPVVYKSTRLFISRAAF